MPALPHATLCRSPDTTRVLEETASVDASRKDCHVHALILLI